MRRFLFLVPLALLTLAFAASSTSAATLGVKAVAAPSVKSLHVGERIYAPKFHKRVRRYQWLLCNRHGGKCVKIKHATLRSYVIRAKDLAHIPGARGAREQRDSGVRSHRGCR